MGNEDDVTAQPTGLSPAAASLITEADDTRKVDCWRCGGCGELDASAAPCPACDGKGYHAADDVTASAHGASPAAASRSREGEIVPTYWCSFCNKTSVAERDDSGVIVCPTEGCPSHE